MPLPQVPRTVTDAAGRARIGTYEGGLGRVELGALKPSPSRLGRLARRKRWHYSLLTSPEVVALLAVVDLGYTANAFACAVDLGTKKVLADESFLSPPGPWAKVGDHPGEGLSARFKTVGARLAAERPSGEVDYRLSVEVAAGRAKGKQRFALDALVRADGARLLTVIAPVAQSGVNITQKSAAMASRGKLEAGGKVFSLEGGLAGMDYTQGLLARRTAWRWAFAIGRDAEGAPIGLNLVEGFNELVPEANENALFTRDGLTPLGRARFSFDRGDYTRHWRAETVDGAARLEFTPIHVHHELRDLKLVKSRFVQVVGLFHGEVRQGDRIVRFDAVPGVTEDQDVLW